MRTKSIIVVGTSGSGKTTAVNGVRNDPELCSEIVVPKRYITRDERLRDDTGENEHVSHAVFSAGVSRGLITPYWQRDLGTSIERYGFETMNGDKRLRIFSANNAFLRDHNSSLESVLESGLVVAVHATRAAREERLLERSPDMDEVQRAKRLGDRSEDVLALPGVIVIETDHMQDIDAQGAFRQIIVSVLTEL